MEKMPKTKSKIDPKLAELEHQLKRVAADFDNYRKHAEAERKDVYKMAQAATLLELAPVLDNFRRATEHLPAELSDNNWATGVMYIEKQLEQIFADAGISRIKTVGEEFNHNFHEAVETTPSDEIPANHIIAELEGGYTMGDQVLKPAKVRVSSDSNNSE